MKVIKMAFVSLLLLAAFAMILSSCSTTSTTTSSTTSSSTTASTAPVTSSLAATSSTSAAAAPQYGGVLKLSEGVPEDAAIGDPFNIFGPFSFHASIAIERLFLPSTATAGSYVNVLATGYKLASDKSYYDISLRQGVTFHDGTPFNAAAAKWNLDRVLAATVPELRSVKSIDVVDNYTIRLNLSSWTNQIINDLTHDCCSIISPTAFQKNGDKWAAMHPIGTGPFIFNEAKSSPTLSVFDRNPNYWQNGRPYLDGIENNFIADQTAQQAALLSGEIDGTWSAPKQVQLGLKSNPNFRTWVEDGEFVRVIYMNTTDPKSIWYDPRMRQALEYAVNKEPVIQNVGIPYSLAGYNVIKGLEEVTQENITPRKYDPAKAKELMKEAGYPNGVEFKLYCSSANWSNSSGDVLTAWQEQWAAAGFKVDLEQIDAAQEGVYSGGNMPGNDVLYYSVRGNKSDPMAVVVENLSPGSRYFTGTTKPADWNDLTQQALMTEDIAQQLAILVKMDQEAYASAMVVPLDTGPMVALFNNRVHDIIVQREGYTLANTWLSK
jgi:glutathione transport system substrate-binding protein